MNRKKQKEGPAKVSIITVMENRERAAEQG